MAQRIGLYPGTFDPLTNGHLDIIRRAAKLVDKLIIGVAVSNAKAPLFSLEDRLDMARAESSKIAAATRSTITVDAFEGLLIHYAEKTGAQFIIRGLRAVSDFEYEFQMAGMNDRLNPDIETVFLMADAQHQAIASRLVKEIALLGGDVADFTTPAIAARLAKRSHEMASKEKAK